MASVMKYGLYLEVTFLNDKNNKVKFIFENSKLASQLSLDKVKQVFQDLITINQWRDTQGNLIKSVYTARFIEQAIWKENLN